MCIIMAIAMQLRWDKLEPLVDVGRIHSASFSGGAIMLEHQHVTRMP